MNALLREALGIHVEDDGDFIGEGGIFRAGLDVLSQGAGAGGAEHELEAGLVVNSNKWVGEGMSNRMILGKAALRQWWVVLPLIPSLGIPGPTLGTEVGLQSDTFKAASADHESEKEPT